jgi:hypothetical protein
MQVDFLYLLSVGPTCCFVTFEAQLSSWRSFLVPTSKKLVVYILDESRVWFFLSYTQPKKCSKFGNWVNACSNICIEKYMRMYKFAKSSQIKSTSFVVVQVVRRNI